jgi:CHASE3 domain sensor protein
MTTALMARRKTMAEPHETPQEKETRWTAQRAAHDEQQHAYRAARTREIARNWLVVGAIVIIVSVMAAAVLL